MDQVLQRTYGNAASADIPRRVLVPALPEDVADLEEWLRARRGKAVTIQVAQRGRKAELMKTASLNAQQALMLHKTRRTSDYVARSQAITDLQEALGLAEAPLRIECFDVSHLSEAQRTVFVKLANAQRCTCGCGYTLAGCRTYDPTCEVSLPRVEALLDSVRRGLVREAPDGRTARAG